MEIGDFSIFVLAPFLLVPLVLAFMTLKRMGWPNDRLFMDAWISFLTIVLSFIVSLFALAAFSHAVEVYWELSDNFWIILNFFCTFLLGTIFVFLTLTRRRRRDTTTFGILAEENNQQSIGSSILRTSVVISFVLVGSVALTLIAASGVSMIYDHYFPSPKLEFGVYDI